jgi:hypothetical protein
LWILNTPVPLFLNLGTTDWVVLQNQVDPTRPD